MNIGIYLRATIELNDMETKALDADYTINIFDQYALEEALRLKDKSEDIRIIAFLIGNEKEKEVINKALSLNVDEAVHISNSRIISTREEAFLLKDVISKYNIDLFITGFKNSSTGEFALTGYLAQLLDYNSDNNIINLELDSNDIVYDKLSNSSKVKVHLPAVLGIGKGILTLRHATLKGILSAKKKSISVIENSDIYKNIEFENIRTINVVKENKIYDIRKDEDISIPLKVISESIESLV